MKTTLEMPDDLFQRAKREALERKITLKSLVIEALESALGAENTDSTPIPTPVWRPADGRVAPRLSSEAILQMIRSERDGGARMEPEPADAHSESNERLPGSGKK